MKRLLLLLVALTFLVALHTVSSEARLFVPRKKETKVYEETGIANITQLTFDESDEITPSFSPDGEKIIFSSDRGGSYALWSIRSDGTGGMEQITIPMSGASDFYPSISPDNKWAIFTSTRTKGVPNIWTIFIGSRGMTQLTSNRQGCISARFSPSGDKIAYSARNNQGKPYIWVMNVDGTNQQMLTFGLDPAWTPDGEAIIFSRDTTMYKGRRRNWAIDKINKDGTGLTQLTFDEHFQEYEPSMSPDGRWIAYRRTEKLKEPKKSFDARTGKLRTIYFKSNIYVKSLEDPGLVATQLTNSDGTNSDPAWSPDGRYIVFSSNRSGNFDIWLMQPNLPQRPGVTSGGKEKGGSE